MEIVWLWPIGLVLCLVAWPVARMMLRSLPERPVPVPVDPRAGTRVHLVRAEDPLLQLAPGREDAERQLHASGFRNAGTYRMEGAAEFRVTLWANEPQSAYALLYHHPVKGTWCEFVTRYTDGSVASYSTLEPVAYHLPQGSMHVSKPRLSPGELWQHMLRERPARPMLPCRVTSAVQDFEAGHERAARRAAPIRRAA